MLLKFVTMKKLIFPLLLCFFSIVSIAQSNWSLYKSVDGVNIYTKESDCYPQNIPSQKVILIKIENTLNLNISISWKLRVWYDNKESELDPNDTERIITFNLSANQSIEGDCSLSQHNLYLYKQFLEFKNAGVLTKFMFENITITK